MIDYIFAAMRHVYGALDMAQIFLTMLMIFTRALRDIPPHHEAAAARRASRRAKYGSNSTRGG